MRLLVFLLSLSICAATETIEYARELTRDAMRIGVDSRHRQKVEMLLLQAADIWEKTDPQSPEYAQVLIFLGALNQGVSPEPFYRKALSIYDHSNSAVATADVALALELLADSLKQGAGADEAKPFRERAVQLRMKHIQELQTGAPVLPPGSAKRIGNGITAPRVTRKKEPAYSPIARLTQQQGTAIFFLVVGTDGLPYHISLIKSVGYGLDEEGLRALRQWKFRPGLDSEGHAVAIQCTIEVNFRLV